MANKTDQKIRLLALYDFLQSKTDETHPMSTTEILVELEKRNLSVDRKTFYGDIELLNKYGYEIICERSRNNRYYVANRKFERSEVQVLLSAVGASQLLSDKKTATLIQKLLTLLGVGEAEELQEQLANNSIKHSNERIYYSIDAIITAIHEMKKVSFLYFDYAPNGQREYRKGKKRYYVNPLGLAYSDDKLYLVCYHDKFDTPTNYRIDRMDEAHTDKHSITEKTEFADFDINKYRQELFNMYSGKAEEIELVFPQDLLEIAIDRFGEDISPIYNSNGEYVVKAKVQVSKTFFAWLTTFEGRVKIKSSDMIKEQYAEFIKNLQNNL